MGEMLTAKWKQSTANTVSFFCPGCKDIHTINIDRWSFVIKNNKATVEPSVLVTSGHFVPNFNKEKDSCWCEYYKENPNDDPTFKCGICHSFIKDDVIMFLGDCTHELANQSVPLPDFKTKG